MKEYLSKHHVHNIWINEIEKLNLKQGWDLKNESLLEMEIKAIRNDLNESLLALDYIVQGEAPWNWQDWMRLQIFDWLKHVIKMHDSMFNRIETTYFPLLQTNNNIPKELEGYRLKVNELYKILDTRLDALIIERDTIKMGKHLRKIRDVRVSLFQLNELIQKYLIIVEEKLGGLFESYDYDELCSQERKAIKSFQWFELPHLYRSTDQQFRVEHMLYRFNISIPAQTCFYAYNFSSYDHKYGKRIRILSDPLKLYESHTNCCYSSPCCIQDTPPCCPVYTAWRCCVCCPHCYYSKTNENRKECLRLCCIDVIDCILTGNHTLFRSSCNFLLKSIPAWTDMFCARWMRGTIDCLNDSYDFCCVCEIPYDSIKMNCMRGMDNVHSVCIVSPVTYSSACIRENCNCGQDGCWKSTLFCKDFMYDRCYLRPRIWCDGACKLSYLCFTCQWMDDCSRITPNDIWECVFCGYGMPSCGCFKNCCNCCNCWRDEHDGYSTTDADLDAIEKEENTAICSIGGAGGIGMIGIGSKKERTIEGVVTVNTGACDSLDCKIPTCD